MGRADLTDALERAREAWPGIDLPDRAFVARVDELLAGGTAGAIDQLHTEGLYIAIACREGARGAIAALEARYFGDLGRVIAGFDARAGFVDEISQRLREMLFVSRPDRPAKIGAYTGRGDLGRWLKVVATREAMAAKKKSSRETPVDASVFADRMTAGEDQELKYLKELYRTQFKAAFEEAFNALEARERTILRYQVIDGLNIDQIGAIYGVHRATVARWQQAIRAALLEKTRDALMAKAAVGRGELDSIMRLIQSQLDVSIVRLLKGEREPE